MSATHVPARAVEIAPVNAHAEAHNLSVVLAAFAEEVARIGGDFAKVDAVLLSFGGDLGLMSTPVVTGTPAGRYVVMESVRDGEEPTLTVVGRALRTERAQ